MHHPTACVFYLHFMGLVSLILNQKTHKKSTFLFTVNVDLPQRLITLHDSGRLQPISKLRQRFYGRTLSGRGERRKVLKMSVRENTLETHAHHTHSDSNLIFAEVFATARATHDHCWDNQCDTEAGREQAWSF